MVSFLKFQWAAYTHTAFLQGDFVSSFFWWWRGDFYLNPVPEQGVVNRVEFLPRLGGGRRVLRARLAPGAAA